MQMKPKGVTTQTNALDEYIIRVLIVLLLKRVHFLQMKPKGVTTQTNVLDEYIIMVLIVLVLKKVHFLANDIAVKGLRWMRRILEMSTYRTWLG